MERRQQITGPDITARAGVHTRVACLGESGAIFSPKPIKGCKVSVWEVEDWSSDPRVCWIAGLSSRIVCGSHDLGWFCVGTALDAFDRPYLFPHQRCCFLGVIVVVAVVCVAAAAATAVVVCLMHNDAMDPVVACCSLAFFLGAAGRWRRG